jgi:hypothetical protein
MDMRISSSRSYYDIKSHMDVESLIIINIMDFAKERGLSLPDAAEIRIIKQELAATLTCMTVRTSCDEVRKGENIITALALPQGASHRKSQHICMTAIAICTCK